MATLIKCREVSRRRIGKQPNKWYEQSLQTRGAGVMGQVFNLPSIQFFDDCHEK